MRNKISKAAGILKKLRAYVNIDTTVNLYYSFVHPYFMYCVHVWRKTYVTNLECLNIMHRSIVRIIAGVSPKEHTAPLFVKFKMLILHQLVDYGIGVFMYKVLYKNVPKFSIIIFFQIMKSMIITLVKRIISILKLSKPTDEIWQCDTKVLKYGTSYQITIYCTKEVLPCLRRNLNLIFCLRCNVTYQVPICLERYVLITLWLALLH